MNIEFDEHDFRPAPPGWTVWECWSEDDDATVTTYEPLPLAGWLVEVAIRHDGFDGYAPTGRRRIAPAIWSTGDAELLTLEDYTVQNNVVYLVGPGQVPPSHDEAEARLRVKMRRPVTA